MKKKEEGNTIEGLKTRDIYTEEQLRNNIYDKKR